MTVSDPPDQSAHSMTNTRLRGNMSAFKLLFTVLAFNGPIIAVVAFLPVVIGYGNGLGAPVMYLSAGVIIALFAVGFVKMSRHVDNPGGFSCDRRPRRESRFLVAARVPVTADRR